MRALDKIYDSNEIKIHLFKKVYNGSWTIRIIAVDLVTI